MIEQAASFYVFNTEDKGKYKTGNGSGYSYSQIIPVANYNAIKTEYKNKLLHGGKETAQVLENDLNKLVSDNVNLFNEILEQVPNNAVRKTLETFRKYITFDYNTGRFSVNDYAIMSDYNNNYKEFKQSVKNYLYNTENLIKDSTKEKIMPKKNSRPEIETFINHIRGRMNSLQGKIFESAVNTLISKNCEVLEHLLKQGMKDLVQDLKKGILDINNPNLKLITTSTEDYFSQVIGDISKEDVIPKVQFTWCLPTKNNEVIGIKGGKIKTDVSIKNEKNGGAIGLNLKNYTGSSFSLGTHMIASLIAGLPTDSMTKKLMFNILSSGYYVSEDGANTKEINFAKAWSQRNQYNLINQVFAMQAMSGGENEKILSDFLIINTGKIKEDGTSYIKVFSIKDIILGNYSNNINSTTVSDQLLRINYPRQPQDYVNTIYQSKMHYRMNIKVATFQNALTTLQ